MIYVASNKVDDVQEKRISKQVRTGRNLGNDFIAYIIDNDAICYSKAIKSLNAFWLETINIELDSIISNHAWEFLEFILRPNHLVVKMCFRRSLNQMMQ
jgi:hypothetical protein